MRVEVEETKGRKLATAVIRGGVIYVTLPHHWPRPFKKETTDTLVRRLLKQEAKDYSLLKTYGNDNPITITTDAELRAYVDSVNADTFNIPFKKTRIGQAKFSRLAQINLKTLTITISKYCLSNVSEKALRYLVIHELAHYYESGHGNRFWHLVKQHCQDWPLQSKVIQAHHRRAVNAPSEQTTPVIINTPKPVPVNNVTPFRPQSTQAETQPEQLQQKQLQFLLF